MIIRVLLAVAGVAAAAWGALLALDLSLTDNTEIATWLVAGPLVHDLLAAPLVGVLGLLLARVLPPPWRTPVVAGAVLSAVLFLLAMPLLWRRYPAPVNPGLHDRDYGPALLACLAVVWVAALGAGAVRAFLSARVKNEIGE